MQHLLIKFALSLAILLPSLALGDDKKDSTVELFNGKDLSNWTFFLTDANAKLEDVWSVKDSTIICRVHLAVIWQPKQSTRVTSWSSNGVGRANLATVEC